MTGIENKKTLLNIPSLISSLFVLFFVSFDFSERFIDQTNLKGKESKVIAISPLTLPQTKPDELTKVNQSYQQYQEKMSIEQIEEPAGMSVAEQAQQHGELMAFFINDQQITLKAVINNKSALAIALLQISNIKTGEKSIERFANNSQVYGYQLTINNHTQVSLAKMIDLDTEQVQKVFLTMYKPASY